MKQFFTRRFLGVPLVVLLVLTLAGGVLAANFLVRQSTLNVTVSEGFSIQWSYNVASLWYPMDPQLDVFDDVIEGDQITIYYRIHNLSKNKGLTAWLELDTSANVTCNATHEVFTNPGSYISAGDTLEVSAVWTFPEGLVLDSEDYWTDVWYWRLYRTS